MVALTGLLSGAQVAVVVVQAVFQGISAVVGGGKGGGFQVDSTSLFLAQLFATLVVLPATWWIAHLAKTGRTGRYLAFRPFQWRPFLVGLVGVVVIGVVSSLVVTEDNEVMVELFRNGGSRPLLWIAVSLFAPVAEEVVFRGFVFEGLSRARGGAVTASITSSFVWALIHLQYSWREMSVIFVLGLLLGWVRHRSGSVWVCMALHAANNLASCMAMEWELRHGSGL